jgi:DNA-binding transcriptional ArsR family regulator
MEEDQVVRALSALAQPTRLRLFRLLVVAGHQGLTPGDLAASTDVAAATLSFHLKELLNAGLVTAERRSRHIVYRVTLDAMNQLVGYLTEHCCQGDPCELTTSVNACC